VRTKKVRDRRATHTDGMTQDVLQCAPKRFRLMNGQRRSETRRVNAGSPQALVRIDIADAPENGLIKEQGLDARSARADAISKFCGANLQRLSPKTQKLVSKRFTHKIGHATEAARIGVAKFAAIVEFEKDMSVLLMRLGRALRREMAGHTEMNEERAFFTIRGRCSVRSGRRKVQEHELAVTLDGFDAAARKMLLQRHGIIDEIGLAEPNGKNTAAGNGSSQAARNSLDFGKFRHVRSTEF